MQTDFDKNLLTYFTDVEYLRNAFKEMVAAPTLAKRLLIIHGIGVPPEPPIATLADLSHGSYVSVVFDPCRP